VTKVLLVNFTESHAGKIPGRASGGRSSLASAGRLIRHRTARLLLIVSRLTTPKAARGGVKIKARALLRGENMKKRQGESRRKKRKTSN